MDKKMINEILEENRIVAIVKEKKEGKVDEFLYEEFITIGLKKDKAYLHHKSSLLDMLYAMNLLQDVVRKTMEVMTDEQRERVIKQMDALSDKINDAGGIQATKVEDVKEE